MDKDFVALITRLKADDYQKISTDDRLRFNSLFAKELKQNPQQTVSLIATANEQIKQKNREIEKHFNLSQHIVQLTSRIDNVAPRVLEDTISRNNKVFDVASVKSLISSNEIPSSSKRDEYCHQAQKILANFVQTRGKANALLAETIKDKKINFKIVDSAEVDGRFAIEKWAYQGKLEIELNKACFASENKEVLPILLAHELGHMIDVCSRPKGYSVSMKNVEEHFADICAVNIAQCAGYSTAEFIAFLGAHGQKHRAEFLKKVNYQARENNILSKASLRRAMQDKSR